MHCLEFLDVSTQYKTIIDNIKIKVIQNIYSEFTNFLLFSYYQYNQSNERETNELIENFLFNSLKNFKFITYNYTSISNNNNDGNIFDITICVENQCFIIEKIHFEIIQKIINKLKNEQISILNVGHNFKNITKTNKEEAATEEVNQFCINYGWCIRHNSKIKLTIYSIVGFIIRRNYYPSDYFENKLFFIFNQNLLKSNESKIKEDLFNFIFSLNQYDIYEDDDQIYNIINEFKERIAFNEKNYEEKNDVQYFKEDEFIKLKTFVSDSKSFTFSVCIHIETLYIFMVKNITEEGKASKQTKREIEFCKNYSNRCFTKFFGLVVNKFNEVIGIVMEYMTNDSLFSYLEDNENIKIDETFFMIILLRIGQAIEYLHKNSFFHRDIKPGNILIDHDFNTYISDYETIRHPITENEEITNDICSKLYAAPELYEGENVSFPADIYSYGVLIEELIKKTDNKNVSKNLIKLYESCKMDNPDKRPTIWTIKNALLNELNSFNIFENILTKETKRINKNFIIQFIYEMILTVIQKQDIFIQKLCFENIFCFRRLLLLKEYQYDSILNLFLGQLYRYGYDIAIKPDLFKAEKYFKISANLNNPIAQYNMGIFYLEGFLGEKNYKKAKEYFESAAKQKLPLSINNLGCMYEKGNGVEIDYNIAKKYYETAAEMNESTAINNLGNLYENGLGVNKNYLTARYFYEQSAQLMNPTAFFNLGRLYFKGLGVQRDYLQALFYFEQSAKLNNPDAFCALGLIYSKGYGVQKDYIKAKYFYEIAAQFNDSDALCELGFFYEKGLGAEQNYNKAKEYYELSAKYGNSDALYEIGFFYEKGLGVEQNYNKAKEYYELSAKYGNSEALFKLGFYYEKGLGVEQNYIKAKDYYESSANYENSSALLHLGILYYNGIFTDQNYKKTKEYFELSENKKNINASYYLGNIYRRGLGVKQDYSMARKYYESAAKYNHAGSLLNLGFLYTEGLGVEKNIEVAKKCFELAANQKCSKASLNLGIIYLDYYQDYSEAFQHLKVAAQEEHEALCILGSMYFFGKGVKQDYLKAKYYYELSAQSNNSESLFYLGLMYMNSLGVNKNLDMAIDYLTKSDKLGDFRATCALGIIYSNEMVKQEYGKAIYYFELLAKQNNPIGYNYLGYLYAFSPGMKHNYNKAKGYFELAANLNYLEAFFHLGNIYYCGYGVKKNYHKARKYYEIASKQNNSYAYYFLGMIFLKGYGVEINYKISKKNFELSAQLNNPSALFLLGDMYSSGEYQEYDIEKAIKYFEKCIELKNDKMILKNLKYEFESYFIKTNFFRYRAMNDLGLIYLTIFQDKDENINKAIEYIKNSAFGEYPFGQNNYGLLYQFYINNIQEAVYFYTKSSKNNFALAYYNLGYLKEIDNKIDEAVQLYIKASENESKSLLFHDYVHYDKRLHISKIFIICYTNLKLVDYYLSKDDLPNAKKYFIKSFAKFNLGSYQFKFKFSNENKFSYLKYFILNYPSFNLKNQSNLPSDLDLNIFKNFNNNDSKENKEKSNENNDDSKNKILNYEEIKGKCHKSKNCVCNPIVNNDEKICENVSNLFIYATSENSLKEDFIREIKDIIQIMSKILYTPPYSILFGRIFISIPKIEEFPYRTNISDLFYEGFGIQIH